MRKCFRDTCRFQVPRSVTDDAPLAVSLAPTADATIRGGDAASEAQGGAPALTVRTVARDGGQHKTAVALLRRAQLTRLARHSVCHHCCIHFVALAVETCLLLPLALDAVG